MTLSARKPPVLTAGSIQSVGEPAAEQLLPLLKKLGEQLQRSEAERAALTEKVAALERQQQAQGDNLIRRIQTAIAQTDRHADRLGQRLESITAEEMRLADQIAGIIASVEETRALQSRALTVMPDNARAVAAPAARRPRRLWPVVLLSLAALAASGASLWQSSRQILQGPVTGTRPGAAQIAPAIAHPVAAFLATERAQTPPAASIPADKSLPASLRQLEAQAMTGKATAQHDLAALYVAGRTGNAPDYARAALWFRQAALGGVANARYNLGVLYQQGLGVPRNLAEAVGWYRAAAALGHPEASYNLGIASVEGIGTAYDPVAALADFRAAARAGLVPAAYNLGLLYENGMLGAPDIAQALYWYDHAALLGGRPAATALARLAAAQHLTPADVAQRIAGLNPDMPAVAAAQVSNTPQLAITKPASPAQPAPLLPPSDAAAGDLQPADRATP